MVSYIYTCMCSQSSPPNSAWLISTLLRRQCGIVVRAWASWLQCHRFWFCSRHVCLLEGECSSFCGLRQFMNIEKIYFFKNIYKNYQFIYKKLSNIKIMFFIIITLEIAVIKYVSLCTNNIICTCIYNTYFIPVLYC